MDRAVIFGASRGLGAELVKEACLRGYPTIGFGRNAKKLADLKNQYPLFDFIVADFSKRQGQDEAIRYLLEHDFTKVFCVAGGGPYGSFHEREMKDHEWAWEVSFHFPARVAHALALKGRLETLIFVGSAVAESAPDPLAASYSAAKHALKGLFYCLREEYPFWDLRLFSPGYMDTEMLPANAAVRQKGVHNPHDLARDLWEWSLTREPGGHKLYAKHPPQNP